MKGLEYPDTNQKRSITRMYDQADLFHLLSACPCVDTLLETIIAAPVSSLPSTDRTAWNNFVTLAHEIKDKRTDG